MPEQHSQENRTLLKVLVVGENEEVREWLREMVFKSKLPWRLRFTCPLRVSSPENQMSEQDIIVLIWEKTQPTPLEEVIKRKNISSRSSESVVCEIESVGGEHKLRRTVILAPSINRDDAVFLSEYEIKMIHALPEKQNAWDTDGPKFVQKVNKLHFDESNNIKTPEETAVRKFSEYLSVWERLSDEKRMECTDSLLRLLGDSSRYYEMVARKCIKEEDFSGAELWLKKAISKNPSYLRAVRLLADLYMKQKQFDSALHLFERLKANNPRNFHRLTKIGQCYLSLGEVLKAEKALGDAMSIDEFNPAAREELGKVKCVLGDFETAKILLSNSRNSRQLAAFLNTLGIKLVEQKKFEESIDHYKKAQYVLPGNDQGHLLFFNIGLAYAKWGKFTEASRYLKLALVRDPCYTKAVTLLKTLGSRVPI